MAYNKDINSLSYIFMLLKMDKRTYMRLAAVIFGGAGLLHAVRAFNSWDMNVGVWDVPIWLSWVVAAALLVMAANAVKSLK